MTKTIGKTVMRICYRAALERLEVRDLDEQFDISGLRALEWGNEMEPLAIRAYEAHTFLSVHSPQKFVCLPGRMVGGTPDGLVGIDGVIEVKCPNSDNHLLNLTMTGQESDYLYQMQGYLWLTGRQWCDFVSFDPRFPDPLQLHVSRVERDDDVIAALNERCREMELIIDALVDRFSDVLPELIL